MSTESKSMRTAADVASLPPTKALRRAMGLLMAGTYVFAGVFYWRQNAGDAPGGPVSIVKALWLALTLLWWFALPLLLLADRRLSQAARAGVMALTISMLLRGAVELFMIYVFFNWHCYYGIAHDVFTGALLLGFAARITSRDPLDRLTRLHLRMMAVMFAFETYFAWSFHHQIRLASPELYFVPEDWAKYGGILAPTAVAVVLVTTYSVPFVRRWLGSALVERDLLDHFAPVGRLGEHGHVEAAARR